MAESTSRVINSCPTDIGEQNSREQDIGLAKGYAYARALVHAEIENIKQELRDNHEQTQEQVDES